MQLLLNGNRRQQGTKESLKSLFPLRGFLLCPVCQRRLTGSVSQGKYSKYRYYHCIITRCAGRFRAEILNEAYENELGKMYLKPEIYELFNLILEDENIFKRRKSHLNYRNGILEEISAQQLLLSKARNFFISEKIDFDDFSELKREHNKISDQLNSRLNHATTKLNDCYRNNEVWSFAYSNISQSYRNQDIEGKRFIINLVNPSAIDPFTKELGPLKINEAISIIINYAKGSN